MSNIVIVGFSGAGKSTVGRKLANKLDMTFIDLDLFIDQLSSYIEDAIKWYNGMNAGK